MIIESLLDVLVNLFDFLFGAIEIPMMPEWIEQYVEQFFDALVTGAGLLANYTELQYVGSMFLIIVAIDSAIAIYKVVMWVLRKIPMAGLS